jgi:hypothetical protein
MQPLRSRDIYNFRYKKERELLGGQIPMQFMFRQFDQHDFVWEHQTDAEHHVTYLFFTSHDSVLLFASFPEVILLDCTYQTNRFGLPLLNMVGITNISISFYVAFSFIKSESEEDYRWVLRQLTAYLSCAPGVVITDCDQALSNAVSNVFPSSTHILCRWRIHRSVLLRCKKHFPAQGGLRRRQGCRGSTSGKVKSFMQEWDEVTFAESVTVHRARWRKLQQSYRQEVALISYLRNTWLPLKEKFMSPWVDERLHFGATTTSRVEGAHAVLKRYLQVSLLAPS